MCTSIQLIIQRETESGEIIDHILMQQERNEDTDCYTTILLVTVRFLSFWSRLARPF
jgi:hypothetical protein